MMIDKMNMMNDNELDQVAGGSKLDEVLSPSQNENGPTLCFFPSGTGILIW